MIFDLSISKVLVGLFATISVIIALSAYRFYRKTISLIQSFEDDFKGHLNIYFTLLQQLTEQCGKPFTILKKEVEALAKSYSSLGSDLHSYLTARSLGLLPEEVPLRRFIPMKVYLPIADQAAIQNVSDALFTFSQALGLEIADDLPAKSGSWYKRWFTKTKTLVTQPNVVDRLQKAERALELTAVQKQQAIIDKDLAEAAGVLLHSVEKIPNAVCQIGSILVVKVTDAHSGPQIFLRSLSIGEMMKLERNPQLLEQPERILKALATFSDNQEAK